MQQQLPWAHTADLTGELQLNLNWTLFDRGARKNNLAKAQANLRAAEARVNATQNNIADEVWKAYSNLETALGQRQAAAALSQRPINRIRPALESYNDGVRNLLDVTAPGNTGTRPLG